MKLPASSCGVSCAELRRSPTRLRSHELRRGRLAIPPCSKLLGIPAKANEIPSRESHHKSRHFEMSSFFVAGRNPPVTSQHTLIPRRLSCSPAAFRHAAQAPALRVAGPPVMKLMATVRDPLPIKAQGHDSSPVNVPPETRGRSRSTSVAGCVTS
jgi:hypothetical protein